jgi:hypothetical protein
MKLTLIYVVKDQVRNLHMELIKVMNVAEHSIRLYVTQTLFFFL